jgi:hypothetical protein
VALPFPEKVKTISWNQGTDRLRRGMRNGELKNLWIGEQHDSAKGVRLFVDILTDVNEISNAIIENAKDLPIDTGFNLYEEKVASTNSSNSFLFSFKYGCIFRMDPLNSSILLIRNS